VFQKIDLAKHFYFSSVWLRLQISSRVLPNCSITCSPIRVHRYTYDLTSTLQANLTGVRSPPPGTATEAGDHQSSFRVSTQYMWNYHLFKDAFPSLAEDPEGRTWKGNLGGQAKGGNSGATCVWVIPLVYGHVDQASESAGVFPYLSTISESNAALPSSLRRARYPRSRRLRDAHRSTVEKLCRCEVSATRSQRTGTCSE
jgi:hypothetical protein